MDHRFKASIQWMLSVMPAGTRVNNWLQGIRNMMPQWYLENKLNVARELLELYDKHATTPAVRGEIRSLEIGAGWDLLLPFAMKGSGSGEVHCIDIFPHLDELRIRKATELLGRLDPEGCATRLPVWSRPATQGIADHLAQEYGIRYRAPCDARKTAFDSGSFDLFLSYNVLEHIPATDILKIHAESFRLLKPGGIAIHHVDLQDHWAYATPKRSVHGFLGNGPSSWRLLNPPIHFQNRMRSREHIEALESVGYRIVLKRETAATAEQLASLKTPGAVHPTVGGNFSLEELGVTYLVVVAKKDS